MKRKIPLKHYRKYPPELKLAVCKDKEKGLSLRECAKKYKLFRPGCKKPPDSLILGWEKLYKELGPKCFFVNRQGNCLDNSVMENFFGRLKMETVYLYKVHSLPKLIDEIREYIDYYNYDRVKEKLNGLSPVSYRQRYYEQLL